MSEMELKLISLLKEKALGEKRSLKSKYICEILEIDGCTLRGIVNKLRTKNYPICSTTNGYFWGENKNELYKTINQLKHRVDGINNAIMGLEKCCRIIEL